MIREKLLSEEAVRYDSEAKSQNSVITTWLISFEYLKNARKIAADLLSFVSSSIAKGFEKTCSVLVSGRLMNI